MACRFAAYESTFTCSSCATSTDCCLLDRYCVQSLSYAFGAGAVVVVTDQIELVHSLPRNVATISFRGNGLRHFGLATDAAALTSARTTQLSINDNPTLRDRVLLPSGLQVLTMSNNTLDRAVLVLPPTLSHLHLDDCGLHSLLNVTFPASRQLTSLSAPSAKRNFLTRFERMPMSDTIDLSSNQIKLVRLQDFQNASTLILDNNTDLATVFASGSAPRPFLRLQCAGCNLTTVAVDEEAFLSLQDAVLPPTRSWRPCPSPMRAQRLGDTHVCVGALNPNAFVPMCPFGDMVAGSALTTAHCTTLDALYCVVDRFCHEAEPFIRTNDILLDFGYVDDPVMTAKFQRRQLQVAQLPHVDTLTIRNALDVRFLGDADATLRSLRLETLTSWNLVDPKTSVLPRTLETFACVACGWKVLPTSYAWPDALQHLTLKNTQLLSFPSQMRWPGRLATFDAANNQMELFTGLPTVTAMLNLSGNALHNALMRNFHGATILDLSYNAPLVSVVFLSSSATPPTLQALHLEGCDSLVNITLDAASYAAVKDTVHIFAPSTAWHGEPCLRSKLQTINSTRLGVCVIEDDFAYGTFFGIVLGVCVLLVITGAWMRWWHRRTVPENDAFKAMTTTRDDNDDDHVRFRRVWTSTSLVDMAATMTSGLLPYRLNTDVEILETVLGRGAYGEVVLGRYNDKLVAVKRLRADNYTVAHMEMLIQEIELMARFSSEYLVAFVGASWCTFADMKCVVEYMAQGDLQQYLASTKDDAHDTFPWSAKLQCMRRMLRGLVYLHSANVIHRDLKSRNVLLNDAGDAKLGDFGIAREVSEESMTNAVGTYRWTAPEVLKGKHYDEKADIYSFGMILTELDTHALPYADMVNERGQALGNFTIMYKVMQGTILPTLSPTCSPWLRDMVFECIAHDASMRPSAADLDARLAHVDL